MNITAFDADEGPGGEIFYDFLREGDAYGLLTIDTQTGQIKTKSTLTGKGRSEPYDLIVRAQDNGGRIEKQKSLFNDVTFVLFIGDVISNYAPYFISPKLGQIANVTEVIDTVDICSGITICILFSSFERPIVSTFVECISFS